MLTFFLTNFTSKKEKKKDASGFTSRGKQVHWGCSYSLEPLTKSIRVADFLFVLVPSCPTVKHPVWLSRNIHSILSLPISRCNKMHQLLLRGTLKGILWGLMRESRAEWQPMPQPILTLSRLERGGGRSEDWGGGLGEAKEEEKETGRRGGKGGDFCAQTCLSPS